MHIYDTSCAVGVEGEWRTSIRWGDCGMTWRLGAKVTYVKNGARQQGGGAWWSRHSKFWRLDLSAKCFCIIWRYVIGWLVPRLIDGLSACLQVSLSLSLPPLSLFLSFSVLPPPLPRPFPPLSLSLPSLCVCLSFPFFPAVCVWERWVVQDVLMDSSTVSN